MRQQIGDIVSISNVLGHPDILLTMECSPKWADILRSIFTGKSTQDRVEMSRRLLRMKRCDLMCMGL